MQPVHSTTPRQAQLVAGAASAIDKYTVTELIELFMPDGVTAVTDAIVSAGVVRTVAGRVGDVILAEADITGLPADLAAKSPLVSPIFSGTPTVPTAAISTSTDQVASTAYVLTAINNSSTSYNGGSF